MLKCSNVQKCVTNLCNPFECPAAVLEHCQSESGIWRLTVSVGADMSFVTEPFREKQSGRFCLAQSFFATTAVSFSWHSQQLPLNSRCIRDRRQAHYPSSFSFKSLCLSITVCDFVSYLPMTSLFVLFSAFSKFSCKLILFEMNSDEIVAASCVVWCCSTFLGGAWPRWPSLYGRSQHECPGPFFHPFLLLPLSLPSWFVTAYTKDITDNITVC